MMNDALCTYDGRRDEVLVAYLYDDIDPDERDAFERHLAACLPCRTELDALSGVRDGLAAWAAPDTADGIGGTAPRSALRIVKPDDSVRATGWRVLADAPIWMQAAAAMLVVAASLGLANINLTYGRDRVTLTTGWLGSSTSATQVAAQPESAVTPAAVAAENARLRAEMVALRQQIDEVKAQAVAAAPKPDDGATTRQVRLQLQESERRQQREFDLRFAEMARDFQSQRQADLVKFDRVLGLYQNRTGMQVAQQQQQLKSLAQRVSQQP